MLPTFFINRSSFVHVFLLAICLLVVPTAAKSKVDQLKALIETNMVKGSMSMFSASLNHANEKLNTDDAKNYIVPYLTKSNADVICVAQQEGYPQEDTKPMDHGIFNNQVSVAAILGDDYTYLSSVSFIGQIKRKNSFIAASCAYKKTSFDVEEIVSESTGFRRDYSSDPKREPKDPSREPEEGRLKGGASITFTVKNGDVKKTFTFSSVHLNTVDGQPKHEQLLGVAQNGMLSDFHFVVGDYNSRSMREKDDNKNIDAYVNMFTNGYDPMDSPALPGVELRELDALLYYKSQTKAEFTLPGKSVILGDTYWPKVKEGKPKAGDPKEKEEFVDMAGEMALKKYFDLISAFDLFTPAIPDGAFPSYSVDPNNLDFLMNPKVNVFALDEVFETYQKLVNPGPPVDPATLVVPLASPSFEELKLLVAKHFFKDKLGDQGDAKPVYVYTESVVTPCLSIGYTDRVGIIIKNKDDKDKVEFNRDLARWGIWIPGGSDHNMVGQHTVIKFESIPNDPENPENDVQYSDPPIPPK